MSKIAENALMPNKAEFNQPSLATLLTSVDGLASRIESMKQTQVKVLEKQSSFDKRIDDCNEQLFKTYEWILGKKKDK